MSADAGLRSWLGQRASNWQSLAAIVQRLHRGRDHRSEDVLAAIEGYRTLGRDLSVARRVLPGTRATFGLEALYARLHAIIHRAPHRFGSDLVHLFRDEVPRAARELRVYIIWVTALFIVAAFAGWWLIATFPELVSLVASDEMIARVESGKLWTDDLLNVTPSSVLSVRILSNNIAVSIAAFCFGLLFGLGTFYIIALNGLMLGAIFAFTYQHGLAGRLFNFVIAHGVVELSVICLAGAAGMALGAALAVPTHRTRLESFQAATRQSARILALCAVLLIGCGLIEGYVSPNPSFPLASRIVIGVGYWVIMLAALSGHLFRRLRA